MSLDKSGIIQVSNVSRSFRSVKKAEGWRGAVNLILKPEYKVHEALKNVSFNIDPGSFIGLIGANGAGKTTLLKILSGLIPASSGEALVLGHNPFKKEVSFLKQISLVMGQKAQLWWDLPALDAFDLLRAIYAIPQPVYKARIKTLTEMLNVTSLLQTQIRRLSLGERMKMELIGALIHWPNVIFLDEPTIGLDVLAAHKLRSFLKDFNQREKATIILTSHNMDDIERLCSRVLILRAGELIYDGSPDGLTHKGERQLRVRLLENPIVENLSSITGVRQEMIRYEEGTEETQTQSILFLLKKEEIVRVLQVLMEKYQIIDMSIEEQSLETVIQHLYATETP